MRGRARALILVAGPLDLFREMSSSEDDARKRLEGRFEEFLSTEKALLDGIDQLVEHLEVVLSNPKWKFKAEQSGLISRTSQAAKNVGALHREMAEVLLLGGNDAGALPLTFESLGSKFEEEYTVYQLVASHAILVLQKLSGGQVGSPPYHRRRTYTLLCAVHRGVFPGARSRCIS